MIHSPTCQHALRAVIFLAAKEDEGAVLVREIAEASNAPHQSLAKILHSLGRNGLVRSTKGPGGGFQLARPANEVKLIEIIEVIDGPLDLRQRCVLGLSECSDESPCALHDSWQLFRHQYFNTVSHMTLREAASALAQKMQAPGRSGK